MYYPQKKQIHFEPYSYKSYPTVTVRDLQFKTVSQDCLLPYILKGREGCRGLWNYGLLAFSTHSAGPVNHFQRHVIKARSQQNRRRTVEAASLRLDEVDSRSERQCGQAALPVRSVLWCPLLASSTTSPLVSSGSLDIGGFGWVADDDCWGRDEV
jgi:hypothetical protein